MADVADRDRPQDRLDHPALRLRPARDAGRHARPPGRDPARDAAAADAAAARPRPARGGARARRDVPVPRRDHPPRARHLPRPAPDLRPLPADRRVRVLRARRQGQGTDGAGAQGLSRGWPAALPRPAHPRLDAAGEARSAAQVPPAEAPGADQPGRRSPAPGRRRCRPGPRCRPSAGRGASSARAAWIDVGQPEVGAEEVDRARCRT